MAGKNFGKPVEGPTQERPERPAGQGKQERPERHWKQDYPERPAAGPSGFYGSFTVEAALVMPLVLAAVFFVILFTFWLHDRTTAEFLVREGVERTRCGTAEEAAGALRAEAGKLLWVPVTEAEIRQTEEETTGTLRGGSVTVAVGRAPAFQAEAARSTLDPPSRLRLWCLLLE